MIWYLLYPFRGTTTAPVLTANHPLRRAFYYHGASVARYWLRYILGSVALAVILCYPVFFLYANPATGSSKLPYHVWTSSSRYTGDQQMRADIDIRQIWVHGSYMKALDKQVLQEALYIQQAVIGDEPCGENQDNSRSEIQRAQGAVSSPPITWAYHSPLSYWNCSKQALSADSDVLRTINDQKQRKTALNFTLRPSSVFAGKSFQKANLSAADTLVITLFDKANNTHGRQWDDRFLSLAQNAANRWTLYPQSGRVRSNRLYKFQFQPISVRDDFIFMVVYASMLVYVLICLRRTRALRSKFGLVFTVIIEIIVSIGASFTMCGFLQVDLSHVPREVYPFVVLVIGIENRFRLINAVLATPQAPIVHRLANAFANVGHYSLATAGQNLLLLNICSKFVSPGVASFCTFAQVALIFDFIFHLTFFTAVLAVDVRRLDLQEFLDRAELQSRPSAKRRRIWLFALWQGQLPYTSRIAGSAISFCLLYFLNTHFDKENMFHTFLLWLQAFVPGAAQPVEQMGEYAPPPINQVRTPLAWLRIQDYQSAKEVINFAKPGAHTLLARVFEPLTVVLQDADRSGVPEDANLPPVTMLRFLSKHLYPLAFLLVVVVALTALLMQYLLWNNLPEDESDHTAQDSTSISMKTLSKGLRLDVVKIASSAKGHLVGVGLDRSTAIYSYNANQYDYSLNVLYGESTTPRLWPINVLALDDTGIWIALLVDDGTLAIWNVVERRIRHVIAVAWKDRLPILFDFFTDTFTGANIVRLIMVDSLGSLLEIDVATGKTISSVQLMDKPLIKAVLPTTLATQSIITIAADRQLYIFRRSGPFWETSQLHVGVERSIRHTRPKTLIPVPGHRLIVILTQNQALLMDIASRRLIHAFALPPIKSSSFRVLAAQRRPCPHCGASGFNSISLAYVTMKDSECILRNFELPVGDTDQKTSICVDPTDGKCRPLSAATESIHIVQEPGIWEATGAEAIIGVRRRRKVGSGESSMTSSAGFGVSSLSPRLRQRRVTEDQSNLSETDSTVRKFTWEAWALFSNGDFCTEPMDLTAQLDTHITAVDTFTTTRPELFVAEAGPIVRLGQRSVAVGFGNNIKIITLGQERFETDTEESLLQMAGGPRKRKVSSRARGST